jgi:hypothetical protein
VDLKQFSAFLRPLSALIELPIMSIDFVSYIQGSFATPLQLLEWIDAPLRCFDIPPRRQVKRDDCDRTLKEALYHEIEGEVCVAPAARILLSREFPRFRGNKG